MGPVPPHDPPHLCVSNGVLLNGGRSSEKQPRSWGNREKFEPQKNSKEQERFLAFLSHEQNSSNGVHNVAGPGEMLMEF